MHDRSGKTPGPGRAPARGARGARGAGAVRHDVSRLTAQDLFLFNEGSHFRLHDKLGAHPMEAGGEEGTAFAVWAPDAARVSVIGEFNGWREDAHPLAPRDRSGIWEGFVPGVGPGAVYKYRIVSRHGGTRLDKADPFGFLCERPPATGSVVWDLAYKWQDAGWMRDRRARNALDAPIAIYEVHPGSWARVPEEGGRRLTWREIGERLGEHVAGMGFSHVELLPIMEHPFYGSWGYQSTGYFAPTSRHGTPQDLMAMIDALHRRGLGVILDWVPSHFPNDAHGLGLFDGTHLFEHADARKGLHPDWNTLIFNYGRHEVRSFLISSALFWLDRYHVDGLRVDAVASMLYLDYSRREGEWIPNEHGGRENLEAIAFLRRLNEEVYRAFPDVQTIAEESTAWPMVSRPTWVGGLGFGLKWDMGWMHDTLRYLARDPVHRRWHHDDLTFRMVYAFHENFVLPLSHDEVVHGKGSLLSRMPGDDWRQFADLRLLYGYQACMPGKKLVFMGGEIAQRREWNHDDSLDWHLHAAPAHAGVRRWLADLLHLYRARPELHELDCDPAGFSWVDCHDAEGSVLLFLRRSRAGASVLCAFNFTPVPRCGYRVGVPRGGRWLELANSDAAEYGGSGAGNLGAAQAREEPAHGHPCSLDLTLPPLGCVILAPE